jgi:hypothetical protein
MRLTDLVQRAGPRDVLEQFLQELQGCEQTAGQIRAALDAVCEALGADTAFWYPGSTSEAITVVGNHRPPAAWCQATTQKLLQEVPSADSAILFGTCPRSASGMKPTAD